MSKRRNHQATKETVSEMQQVGEDEGWGDGETRDVDDGTENGNGNGLQIGVCMQWCDVRGMQNMCESNVIKMLKAQRFNMPKPKQKEAEKTTLMKS